MLQTIREHTQGWIAGIIIGIIILTFALWGIHSYFVGGGSSNVIAEVNGVNISKDQLSMAYDRLRRQMQNANHPSQNEAAMKDQALRSLIEIEVLKQASYAEGFRIFNIQVDNYLQTIPEFQVDGQFSIDKFEHVLSSSLLSTNEFLNLIETSLQIEQPKLGIIFASFALPDETMNSISVINQERDIQYLAIPLSYFLTQPFSISAKQIEFYYNQHKHDYMTPAQVSVEYLQLSVPDLYSGIHPTDAELKNYYNENISSYSIPGGLNKEALPKPYNEVRNSVRDSYIRQQAEEKFADMRDQLSNLTYEHPNSLQYAAKILTLPIKTSELFVKDKAGKDISQYKKVRDVAFSNDVLNLKNNSDVIQVDPQTVIVLRVKSFIPSSTLPLNLVTKQIQDKIKANEAETRGENFAKSLVQKLQDGTDPKQVAHTYNLIWSNSGFNSRYNTKLDNAILDLAFRLPHPEVGKTVYGIAKLENGYAIVGVKGVKPGVLEDKNQYPVFAEQVQNSEGLLEYELYKLSHLKQAKIEVLS